MRFNFATAALVILSAACGHKSSGSNKSDDSKHDDTVSPTPPLADPDAKGGTTAGGTTAGGTVSNPPTPTVVVVTHVNPKAFNGFTLWRDGQGTEILDYPQDYNTSEGRAEPDSVFYVEGAEYWAGEKFIGMPTAGAKVVNDVLEYPVKNGKQLRLVFTEVSREAMPRHAAMEYCKNQGLRLPTARELFDFCATGVTEPNYGPSFEAWNYPFSAQCGRGLILVWSASVNSRSRPGVWLFNNENGSIAGEYVRHGTYGVRCVGG